MLFLDRMSRLQIALCGVELQNPVIAASGTYGYGVEFEKVADLDAIGGIVVKGLSREPISGNPPPRKARGPKRSPWSSTRPSTSAVTKRSPSATAS